MNQWKHFVETIGAIKEVSAAMINQFRNPSPKPTKPQGLEVMLTGTPDNFCASASLSTLELIPSGFENWECFPSAAAEIAQRLLSAFCVLTAVHALPTSGGKKGAFYPFHSQEEVFLHTYAEILQLQGRGDDVHYQSPNNIITVTNGAEVPLTTMLFSGDYGIAFDYNAYGYTVRPPSVDILQAQNSIEKGQCALHLAYERYPDTLEIFANTELFSVSQCLAVIQDVCAERSIPLEIDSALK